MSLDRVYYTYMVQVREGQYETFRDYENKVLPLLPKHQGLLEIRLKVKKTGPNQPDEIHVVSFPSTGDMEAYRFDPERTRYAALFEKSVEFATLIEGYKVL
jgi:hypothetical protein